MVVRTRVQYYASRIWHSGVTVFTDILDNTKDPEDQVAKTALNEQG